jgi:hypothetical protein
MATLSILNSPGPLPLKVTFQAPTDGPVSFAVSGSVSSTTAGQLVGVQVLFDRGVAGTCSVFCNAANSHQTLIPALLQATIPGSGTHAIALVPATPSTQSDANDFYQVTLIY